MSRRSRRLTFRVLAASALFLFAKLSYYRWGLRQRDLSANAVAWRDKPCMLRSDRLSNLQNSSEASPFDVLVIGGGVIGLYAAVDAAQRGLKVAVIDAEDFGSGHTTTAPIVVPSAFPYCQRALRQRDFSWITQAVRVTSSATLWRQVAPHCCSLSTDYNVRKENNMHTTPKYSSSSSSSVQVDTRTPQLSSFVKTYLLAFHSGEFIELAASALLATLITPFCGRQRNFSIYGHSYVHHELPSLGGKAKGAVVSEDTIIDGAKASLSLARTAEALGASAVNYVTFLSCRMCNPIPGVDDPPLICAELHNNLHDPNQDSEQCSSFKLYTRSVLNCAGAWADSVRKCCPDSACDSLEAPFSRYHALTYLVTPKDSISEKSSAQANRSAFLNGGMLLSSTKYSFSNSSILPWADNCVLLGPSVTPLAQIPTKAMNKGACTTLISSSDGFQAQKDRAANTLSSFGLNLDTKRCLSCLTSVVPVLGHPKDIPWAHDIFAKTYYLHEWDSIKAYSDLSIQQKPLGVADSTLPSAHSEGARADFPILHVFGGSPVLARDIAEEAVNKLLSFPKPIFSSEGKKMRACKTRTLPLIDIFSLEKKNESEGSTHMNDLHQILREGYAERITDIIMRRTRIAYSSPAEAVEAIPVIADIMGVWLGWGPKRKEEEKHLALQAVKSIVLVDQEYRPRLVITSKFLYI